MSRASRVRLRFAAAAVASGALAVGSVAGVTLAASAHASLAGASRAQASQGGRTAVYNFRTLDNAQDLTFNQFLGINDHGVIAGYFGSGAQGHPNMGYLLPPGLDLRHPHEEVHEGAAARGHEPGDQPEPDRRRNQRPG